MDTSSYWIETSPLPPFPRLDRSLEVDVAVVGGGITGITAAWLLKKAGRTVALLERGRCASVDTGHTTAHLTAVTDLSRQEALKSFGKDAARAVWDAGRAAIDQIVAAQRAEAIACDFRWVPGYLHAPLEQGAEKERRKEREWLEREAKAAHELDIEAELMPSVPGLDRPGIRFPDQALFHPRRYLAGLLRAIPGEGSHVFEDSAAGEIDDEPLGVHAGGHVVRCRHIVFATHNPHIGASSWLGATLFQTKLALHSSYAIGARIPAGTLPEAAYWDTADPYNYLRVERRGDHDLAIFGGEDHKTGQADDTPERFRRLEERLLRFVPGAIVDHRWSGQVIDTHDGLPYIGEMAAGGFVATGFAGNGMTFGTLGAMMATDWVLGRRNPWADLFDPHRKKLLAGAWSYLKENKDYPYFLVRDWVARAEGGSLDALGNGQGKILHLDGRKVAAYRDERGQVTLCSPVCTHLKCIVDWNEAERTWDCPCHGSRFQPSGEVLSGPAEAPLKKLPLPSET